MTLLIIIKTITILLKIQEPNLLESICYVETNIRNVDNMTDGGSPSYGVCQIKLETANWMKEYYRLPGEPLIESDLRVPEINIFYSGLYLKYNVKRYKGDLKCAISAYNAGRCVTFNSKYVNKVLRRKAELDKKFKDTRKKTPSHGIFE